MTGFYDLIGPALRCLDPETAHGLALGALKRGLVPAPPAFEDPRLRQTLWGLEFASPIGLAAGFDKDADAVDAMLAQGFGFVEAGTVTSTSVRTPTAPTPLTITPPASAPSPGPLITWSSTYPRPTRRGFGRCKAGTR